MRQVGDGGGWAGRRDGLALLSTAAIHSLSKSNRFVLDLGEEYLGRPGCHFVGFLSSRGADNMVKAHV